MKKKAAPPRVWKVDLLAFFSFALLVALFYRKVLFGDSTFVFVDASRFFYPLWKWGAGVWSNGLIPLWNPDAQFGTPYLADPQTACAYPPLVLLYLISSPTWAFSWTIILHHLWALWGFWTLACGQGYSRRSAFLGSLLFGFSLHLICSSWTPVALMTISWVPWVLLMGEKVFRKEKGGFLGLSFVWAMQLAAGYPVLTYLTGLALGFHLVWKGWWPSLKGVKPSFQWVGPVALAALVAGAYNLAWGLPFLELFRSSNYQQGANHFQDLHWKDLATAFAPFFQGHPLEADYHGPHYWVATYFMGLPALCLVVWGGFSLLYRKTSWGVFPLLLILSAGGMGVAEALRAILPGYALVIHSGYWLSLLILWVGLLSTETMDQFIDQKARGGRFSWIVVCLAVYGIAWGLGAAPDLGIFLASMGSLLLAIFFQHPTWRWGLILVSVGLSLGPAANSINILLNKTYYDEKPLVLSSLSKEGRLFFSPALMERSKILEGPTMAAAYENAKQSLYPNWPLTFGREESTYYNTLQLKDSAAWTMQRPYLYSETQARKQLDFLNVRYLFGKVSLPNMQRLDVPESPVEVYENPTCLPKWYSVLKATSYQTDVGQFLRDKAGAMDFARECQVEDDSKVGTYQTRKVSWAHPDPDHVLVTAEGQGKALLVSSEILYPGWKAKVDDREKPVERVNCSFRGVMLGDGENKVDLSYAPVSFRLGLFLCLMVCGFWGGSFLKMLRSILRS